MLFKDVTIYSQKDVTGDDKNATKPIKRFVYFSEYNPDSFSELHEILQEIPLDKETRKQMFMLVAEIVYIEEKPDQQVIIANKKRVHYYPNKMNFEASKFLAYRDHYAKMKKIKDILDSCSIEDLPENEELKRIL